MTTALQPTNAPAYGSPAWQAERRNYVGASDLPRICKVSPYGGPLDVYFEKLGLVTVAETPQMRRGHIYEPAIAQEYAERFADVRLESVPTVAHPKYDWMRASLDRLVHASFGRYILEIKLVSHYLIDRYGEDGSDQLPDDKIVQVQGQMLVTGLSLAHVAVSFGSELRVYVIEADIAVQQMILEAAHAFWFDHVKKGVEPAPHLGVDSLDIIKKKYKKHNGLVIVADDAQTALIAKYAQARETSDAAEDALEALKAQLMLTIGDNYAIDSTAGKVIWPEVKGRESKDFDGLVRDLKVPADVLQRYVSRGPSYRALKYYEPKKGRK